MKDLASQFTKHVNKVYGFWQGLRRIEDGRKSPHVPIESVLACLVVGLVCRVPSLNQIEILIREGVFNRLLKGLPKPSADTIRYTLLKIGVEGIKDLESFLQETTRRARYNKAPVGSVGGLRAVAVDGAEVHFSNNERMCCRKCKVRKMAGGGLQYYEQAVTASYIGDFQLILGIQRVHRGQGEVDAAIHLLDGLQRELFRYCDIIVVDSLYATAPFIKAVISWGKDVLVKVKQENREILRDAEGVFCKREPDVVLEGVKVHPEAAARYDLKIWDEEGFTSWASLGVPVRCIRIEETVTRIQNGQLIKRTYIEHLVTTCPKATTPARVLWTIMHRRWDIENSVFHSLKTYSNFGHCFCHGENAVPAMWLLMAIAFNLLRLFTLRNLRDARDFMSVACLIMITLPQMKSPIYALKPDPG